MISPSKRRTRKEINVRWLPREIVATKVFLIKHFIQQIKLQEQGILGSFLEIN